MKKILFALIALLICVGSTQAQTDKNRTRKGIALGVDNDTLGYLVASPFDNWYFGIGGGVQTLIGTELVTEARYNKGNYNLYAEVGKWVLPDVSLSLYFRFFSIDGQSKYGLNPWIDWKNNDQFYLPFHTHGFMFNGLVTLDWTNFIKGYEVGLRRRFHVMTPLGMGYARMFGKQVNKRESVPYKVGDNRYNQELNISAGLLFQYAIRPEVDIDLCFNLFATHGHWDSSPYEPDAAKLDLVPATTIGLRFNLLEYAYRKNAKTQTRERYDVNHQFLAINPNETLRMVYAIERLSRELDSVNDLANRNKAADPTLYLKEIDSLKDALGDLQSQLDDVKNNSNEMMEVLATADALNLPKTVVYYQLDKYYLDYNAKRKLQEFAKKLKESGTDLTFYIIGAADEQTGTAKHNDWLSDQRCKSVYNYLVNELGVNPNQLVMKPIGGIREFEPQELNRVGIVVLQHDDVTKIIEKWKKIKELEDK